MPTWINGYKSYIVALATVAYAVIGYLLGNIDVNGAVAMAFGGVGLAALRHGVSTVTLATIQKMVLAVLQNLPVQVKSADTVKPSDPPANA